MSDNIDCPIGCESAKFNSAFDECAKQLHFGEITRIAVASNTFVGFTDVEDKTEWESHVASGDIELLVVKGDIGEPEQEEIEGTDGSTIYGAPTFTLNFEIQDLTDENFEMLRKTYCNSVHKIWYLTADHVYGGNAGISSTNVRMHGAIERGSTTLQRINGTAKFRTKSNNTPKRTDRPAFVIS